MSGDWAGRRVPRRSFRENSVEGSQAPACEVTVASARSHPPWPKGRPHGAEFARPGTQRQAHRGRRGRLGSGSQDHAAGRQRLPGSERGVTPRSRCSLLNPNAPSYSPASGCSLPSSPLELGAPFPEPSVPEPAQALLEQKAQGFPPKPAVPLRGAVGGPGRDELSPQNEPQSLRPRSCDCFWPHLEAMRR